MEVLKVYSLRLESESIEQASEIASSVSFWKRSDVLRLAIWIGLKVIDSRHISELHRIWWHEYFKGDRTTLEDVLRAAGVELENLKSSK